MSEALEIRRCERSQTPLNSYNENRICLFYFFEEKSRFIEEFGELLGWDIKAEIDSIFNKHRVRGYMIP